MLDVLAMPLRTRGRPWPREPTQSREQTNLLDLPRRQGGKARSG